MKNIYTAKVNIKGVEGIVGGSSAEDLAQGVKACTEAIEQEIAKAQQKRVASVRVKVQEPSPLDELARLYARVLADVIPDDDEDEDDYEDDDDYEGDCEHCDGRDCCNCPYC